MRKSKLWQEAEVMLIADLLKGYGEWLVEERKNAASTRHTYTSAVNMFARHMGPNAVTADCTGASGQRWATLYGKTHRPRPCRTAIFALRAFGSYAVSLGYLLENPFLKIEIPKLDKAVRLTPTDDQVMALLDAASRISDPYRCSLARALVSTMVYGGMRRSELLNIRVGDVDLRRGEIYIRCAKGGKTGTVCPNLVAMDAIRDYLRVRHVIKGEWLWAQDRTRRLGTKGLTTLMEDLRAIAGERDNKALQPHSIRHNYATRLLRAGVDLETIKEALFHSSITTTALYLHSDVDRLKEVRHLAELKPTITASSKEKPTAPASTGVRRSIRKRTG